MPSSVLEYPFGYTHLPHVSTQVSIAPGTLHTVTINKPDPAAGAIATLYDSAVGVTADIIAIIDMDRADYVIPMTLIYDINFVHGLYVAFSGQTLGDITIGWR